jgi:hypothetical protein
MPRHIKISMVVAGVLYILLAAASVPVRSQTYQDLQYQLDAVREDLFYQQLDNKYQRIYDGYEALAQRRFDQAMARCAAIADHARAAACYAAVPTR